MTANPSRQALATMEQEIAALRALTTEALIVKYREVTGRDPKLTDREWIWRRLAWQRQQERMGGLSKVAQARLEELIAAIELPPDEKRRTVTGKLVKPAQARRPAEGTWIEREYKGAVYRVKILDRGVELDGVPFRSLSALAKKITGSHWNGPAFFGLTPRSKPKPKVTP